MSTAKAIIDVHKGRLSMTVLGQTVEFEVFESMKNPLKGSVCFNITSAEQDDEPHSTFGEYVALAHSEVTNKTPLLKHDSSSYDDTIAQLKEENRELVEKNFELTTKLDEALEENYALQDKIEDDFSLVKDEFGERNESLSKEFEGKMKIMEEEIHSRDKALEILRVKNEETRVEIAMPKIGTSVKS